MDATWRRSGMSSENEKKILTLNGFDYSRDQMTIK